MYLQHQMYIFIKLNKLLKIVKKRKSQLLTITNITNIVDQTNHKYMYIFHIKYNNKKHDKYEIN